MSNPTQYDHPPSPIYLALSLQRTSSSSDRPTDALSLPIPSGSLSLSLSLPLSLSLFAEDNELSDPPSPNHTPTVSTLSPFHTSSFRPTFPLFSVCTDSVF